MSERLPSEHEPVEEWTNCGDADPKRHGGVFLRWTGGEWVVVETTNPDDIGDLADGRHHFDVYEIQPGEVVAESGEWTDAARKEAESLGNVSDHFTPQGAAVDGRLAWLVAGMIHRLRPVGEGEWVEPADYWDHLEGRHEIDPDDFRD